MIEIPLQSMHRLAAAAEVGVGNNKQKCQMAQLSFKGRLTKSERFFTLRMRWFQSRFAAPSRMPEWKHHACKQQSKASDRENASQSVRETHIHTWILGCQIGMWAVRMHAFF